MTIKAIFHSDDFGLHPAVNQAVLEAADAGTLTSASLMINGGAVEDAVAGALKYPGLGVGIHLNIVRGRPLSPPGEIPTLVDARGLFFNDMARLMRRAFLKQIDPNQVYIEYRRQVRRFLEFGVRPTHFDGEKHSHLLIPQAAWALRKIAEEFDVFRVRRIHETPVLKALTDQGAKMRQSFKQRGKLALLEYRLRRVRKHWEPLRSTDFFFGVAVSGNICYPDSLQVLESLLNLPGNAAIEWMFHLGLPFDARNQAFVSEFGDYFLDAARYAEYRFLLSDQVVRLLSQRRHQLINYKDI